MIIPAFAIGRVEELIYWLKRLEEAEADSGAAGVRRQPDGDRRARALHRAAARARSGDAARARATRRRRTVAAAHEPASRRAAPCAPASGRSARSAPSGSATISTASESKQLTQSKMPAIIISPAAWRPAAACCTISRRRCPTRATRCCSSATRRPARAGRQLVDGAKTVKIHGEIDSGPRARRARRIDVGARRLERDPALARRLHTRRRRLTFIVHGEPRAMEALAARSTRRARLERRRCRRTAKRSRSPRPDPDYDSVGHTIETCTLTLSAR